MQWYGILVKIFVSAGFQTWKKNTSYSHFHETKVEKTSTFADLRTFTVDLKNVLVHSLYNHTIFSIEPVQVPCFKLCFDFDQCVLLIIDYFTWVKVSSTVRATHPPFLIIINCWSRAWGVSLLNKALALTKIYQKAPLL